MAAKKWTVLFGTVLDADGKTKVEVGGIVTIDDKEVADRGLVEAGIVAPAGGDK